MIENPEGLISDFMAALGRSLTSPIFHESQLAPHHAHKLRPGACAVYVFSLSENHGRAIAAVGNRILKVGKAGPNCNARFQYQHYHPKSAGSTLAGTLLRTTILWPYLGIPEVDQSGIRRWIEENTDRDNFYLAAADMALLGKLEVYLRGRLGPVFEGG